MVTEVQPVVGIRLRRHAGVDLAEGLAAFGLCGALGALAVGGGFGLFGAPWVALVWVFGGGGRGLFGGGVASWVVVAVPVPALVERGGEQVGDCAEDEEDGEADSEADAEADFEGVVVVVGGGGGSGGEEGAGWEGELGVGVGVGAAA